MKAALGVAAVALAGGSVAMAQTGPNDAANWQAVVACAGKVNTAERHGCVDQVLRAAGVLDPVREAQQQRADFGRTQRSEAPATPPTVPSAPPPVAPAPPAPTAAAVRPAPETPSPAPPVAAGRIDRIVTTIAAARIGGNGRLLVATAEATVWRQLDGESFRIAPSPGTAFEVERGALGSYICKVGRGNSFRCTRVD